MVILEKVLVLRKHVLKHLGIQGIMAATYFQMIQENRERAKERPRGKINNWRVWLEAIWYFFALVYSCNSVSLKLFKIKKVKKKYWKKINQKVNAGKIQLLISVN